jgi:hypothetical protein
LLKRFAEPALRAEEEAMAKKNEQTPAPASNNPRPQRDDLGQPGQERERKQDDQRSRMDEDDEVE